MIKCLRSTSEHKLSQACLGSGLHTWHHTRTLWGHCVSQSFHRLINTQTSHAPRTLEKLNHPHSVPTVRGASCYSIMMIKHFNLRGFPLFRRTISPVCQMIKGSLWSHFSRPICIVWHMLSLIFPWPILELKNIHLMQRINGVELVSALGPPGIRLGAERTLIPTQPHPIHPVALMLAAESQSDRLESR